MVILVSHDTLLSAHLDTVIFLISNLVIISLRWRSADQIEIESFSLSSFIVYQEQPPLFREGLIHRIGKNVDTESCDK